MLPPRVSPVVAAEAVVAGFAPRPPKPVPKPKPEDPVVVVAAAPVAPKVKPPAAVVVAAEKQFVIKKLSSNCKLLYYLLTKYTINTKIINKKL